MIKAVIFDCFGVLTTDGWKQIREQYFANKPELMQHAIDIDKAVNAGMMEYDDFIAEISKMSGLSENDVRLQIDSSMPNTILFEYIRDNLKLDLKIGMLSNAADDWLDELFEPWQIELFDEIALSYQSGIVKPDSRAYTTIASSLGLLPEECIFVDDQLLYCTAAENVGMKAISHIDTHQTIAKIKELLHA